MTKITLTDIVNLQNENTAVNAINTNSAIIETAFDNTLSRDGTAPNQMEANLDMNSNQILNLPAPLTVDSPVRLIDVTTNPTIIIPPTGTSGHVVGYLDGNNTYSGTSTFTNSISGVNESLSGTLGVTGLATLGSANVTGNATVTGTLGVTGVATFTSPPVLPANSIANASLGIMGANTAKGSIAGGTPADLSKTQLTTLINPFTTSLSGAVPASGGGTSNFLRADGTFTQPPASGMVLLNTLTASSSATLSDTTSFTGTYPVYEIQWYNLVPATNNNTMCLQVFAGSYQTTSYLNSSFWTTGTTTIVADAPTTDINLSHSAGVSNASSGASGVIRIFNPLSATTHKHFTGTAVYQTASGLGVGTLGGVWTSNTAVTGFRMQFSVGGNIASGVVKIYGIL